MMSLKKIASVTNCIFLLNHMMELFICHWSISTGQSLLLHLFNLAGIRFQNNNNKNKNEQL